MSGKFARPLVAIGLSGLTLILACACSSSQHSSSTTSSAGASSSVAPAASGTGGAADATVTAAVTQAFVTFFDGKAPLDQRLALLQGASAFSSSLASQSNSAIITQTSATVSKVTVGSSGNLANVTYNLALAGVTALPNQSGIAVKVDGNWKVAAATFCALLTTEGQAAPACTQASVTALPS